MVRTGTMNEAEKAGGRFDGEVAQTITLTTKSDMEFEDRPYSGVTDGDIISLARLFDPTSAALWETSDTVQCSSKSFHLFKKPSLARSRLVDLYFMGTQMGQDHVRDHARRLCADCAHDEEPTPTTHEVCDHTTFDASHQVERGEEPGTPAPDSQCVSNLQTVYAVALESKVLYCVHIPAPSHPSLRQEFFHAMLFVQGLAEPSKRESSGSLPWLVDDPQEAPARKKQSGSSFSKLRQLALQSASSPFQSWMNRREDPGPTRDHTAIIYHPSCQRFLRAGDLGSHSDDVATKKADNRSGRDWVKSEGLWAGFSLRMFNMMILKGGT